MAILPTRSAEIPVGSLEDGVVLGEVIGSLSAVAERAEVGLGVIWRPKLLVTKVIALRISVGISCGLVRGVSGLEVGIGSFRGGVD
jgi:hypothetical protein